MYLFLAFFWAVLGIVWIVWHRVDPAAGDLMVRWTNISAGWFALALAAYNVVRWWSRRALRRQDAMWAADVARHHSERNSARPPHDPAFDFQTPPKGDETRADG